MTELIQLPVSSQNDPTGETVRAILDAHLASARTRAAREFWVHLSATIGAVIIFLPLATVPTLRAILLALWATCGVSAIVTAGLEWRWRCREAKLLSANQAASKV